MKRFLAKDGSVRYCQTTSRPIYEDGKLIAFAGTIRDLTERKLIEKKPHGKTNMIKLCEDFMCIIERP